MKGLTAIRRPNRNSRSGRRYRLASPCQGRPAPSVEVTVSFDSTDQTLALIFARHRQQKTHKILIRATAAGTPELYTNAQDFPALPYEEASQRILEAMLDDKEFRI
jgi:hypothetical protein